MGPRMAITIILLLIGSVSLSEAAVAGGGMYNQHDNSSGSGDPVAPVSHFRASYEERLYDFLFDNYNQHVRPCDDVKCTKPLKVNFGVSMLNAELHFSEKRVGLHSWLRLMWDDPRLTWEPQDYGGVTEIRVPQEGLWLPDITLFTKDQIQGNLDREWIMDGNAVVYNTGAVLIVPPSYLRVPCDFMEGSDEQACSLKFGSWTYSSEQIKLAEYGGGGCDLSDFKHVINDGWTLDSCVSHIQSKTYPCCTEAYESLNLNVTFKKV